MEPAMDLIEIRGIKLQSRIGVTAEERAEEQPLTVSLAARVDTRLASATDDLKATLDYDDTVRLVSKIVADESYALLETLADRIARALLSHPGVFDVWVRIAKPQAALSEEVEEVAVEITRSRDDLAADQGEGRP